MVGRKKKTKKMGKKKRKKTSKSHELESVKPKIFSSSAVIISQVFYGYEQLSTIKTMEQQQQKRKQYQMFISCSGS
ncbi:Chromodomain-Helicase-Dna-Binding Protein 8 [Manis pentadactyla]|nr:Chromodomain-Helicase-Dna-Binding Protein 8 [Manis pentadactyla]